MIDFNQIRGLASGQRHSFEELVCQLARREPVPAGALFRRVEGAGGDGGVEAYWLMTDGTKVGYQAKFFTRTRDIDWAQIDDSVQQALKTHPTLTKYIIALPCNLTDRRGTTRKGKTGWELWDDHVIAWKRKRPLPAGRQIEFVPWTAFELDDRLTALSGQGLLRYWFGANEFSSSWFADNVGLATASLDERYHPEDHVDVSIEGLFQFVVRHPSAVKKLRDRLAEARSADVPDRALPAEAPASARTMSDHIQAAREALLSIAPEFDLPCWEPWGLERWKELATDLTNVIGELQEWAWEASATLSKGENRKGREEIQYTRHVLHNLRDKFKLFEDLISSPYLLAEKDRVAVIDGRAGTGKSHLLGRVAEVAVKEGYPVILILGQQLADRPVWEQITKRLGVGDIEPDVFLQALDAAAEASRKRGVILFDAINEGAGARLWRSELPAFIERIRRFPNLVCILTCRTEHVPYVFPESIVWQRFTIRGFETVQEQVRAARVYMDRRGITRPGTPWLAPEFVNPLFLRSTCLALQRDGKSEFPRGLSGTKEIFAFYLKSVARHLGVGRDGSNDLVPAVTSTLRAISRRMASDRKDYIPRDVATNIANERFRVFPAPQDQSWLDALLRNGLLRTDPDPKGVFEDALAIPDDVVRFSFQRLQDHLIADAILSEVGDVRAALAAGGGLAFVHNQGSINWEWRGLVEALSTHVPERFGLELVDTLPGRTAGWWNAWELQDAFVESIRWRDRHAFTDRTLALFNSVPQNHQWPLSLLIEFSASVDHPWNADFLHNNLSRWKLAKRDRNWTVRLNDFSTEADDPVGRLLDWCLFGQTRKVERSIQLLFAITLCWMFTASNRYVRDRATKALTSLLLIREDLFPELLTKFRAVDDIYVLERLYAAAYGTCCIDPSPGRLAGYAIVTYKTLFINQAPPLSLLLRDYARGIVEISNANGVLPKDVQLEKCRPPYKSPRPRFTLSNDQLNAIVEKAGDDAIARSCGSGLADFGRYEIEPRVTAFTTVPLSSPRPVSRQEQSERFEREVIEIDPSRAEAFTQLRSAQMASFTVTLLKDDGETLTDDGYRVVRCILKAEQRLLSLLSSEERRRYRREVADRVGSSTRRENEKSRTFDIAKVRRWVAKRAYDFGWTKALFPNESSRHRNHSGERPYVERIGKKYQWIALDELLSRLADNYWIATRYVDSAKKYDNPLDVRFERDIDPTIIPLTDESDNAQGARPKWVLGEDMVLDTTPEEQLAAWPFKADPVERFGHLIQRNDDQGTAWTTLYEHRSKTEEYDEGKLRSHGFRQREFRFVLCAVIAKSDRPQLVKFLSEKASLDVMTWGPTELTDGPFLREAPWRDTWPQEQSQRDAWKAPKGMPLSFPVCEYLWESHLDATLLSGGRALIPAPWLARALSLSPDKKDASIYKTPTGEIAFIGSGLGAEGSSGLVKTSLLDAVLEAGNLECVWLFVGERSVWPGGGINDAAWRRSEGLCWLEGPKPSLVTWKRDEARGRSEAGLQNVVATSNQSAEAALSLPIGQTAQ
jgi:hypothetical protein